MSEPHLSAESSEGDETVVEDGAEEVYAFPLSFAQRRLWFLQQLEPSSAAYNVPFASRLSGRLDASALERALNEIVRRHEILRTTFELLDEEPAQVVVAPKHFTLPLLDLSTSGVAEREDRVRRLASEEALRPFDLARGPLLRARLLRLCEEEHVLLLTLHHIVADGWSLDVLVRELSLLYAAYLRGADSPLEELPIQYADFAVWQRETLSEEVLREQLDYWKKALAGAPPVLELPSDRPRPPSACFEGAHESFVLPRALTESLARLGRREGATLHMTLLAAFQVLLARYTGQEDVTVGVPVAGRRRREVEPLIGFFVNTLVLRADLRGQPSFREALRRVRDAALGAYAHQDIPFEVLVEALRPERLLNHTPLFQVMFNFESAPEGASPELEGLTLAAVEHESETARFDLTLEVVERGSRLHCALRYRSALFEAATIRSMAERLRVLLEGIVADASLPVSRLPLSGEEERRRALREWSGAPRQYPTGDCLHRLFERQAARTPDAPALASGGELFTYAEVNREANRLAHHLRRRGLRAEETAAILLERSARYVVAMLAVLKAGAAYVPLDASHPPARLGLVMADARVRLLITEPSWRHVAPPPSCGVVCVEEQRRQIERCDEQNPRGGATAENLAYVIYTSGSTGRPKGVAVEHRQLSNYLHAISERLRLEPGDSYAVVSTLAADLGYTMLWPALCGGGLLHVLSPELCADAAALGEYFREHDIACLKIVPSHLGALLAAEPRVPPLPRKRLVLGGERAHRGLLEQLGRLRPPCAVHNHYGPTETTVGVLTTLVGDADESRAGLTLGRPLGNTTAFVLDAGMQPAPAGLSGELYIGGANVARGYAHDAAATAASFVPDAFSGEPGARLYRTGDLARYSRDGQIEFLGRADEQLKVRGFRIELGEIESTLRGHAAVREAAVLAREVAGGERRLEAYVVTQAPLSVTEAREFLRDRLPEAWIPAAFVFPERLPLTPNGKLDRRALLAAPPPPATADEDFVAPRDVLELQLCRVWEEVLGVRPVGARSRFFELGGHSLLAVRLMARVEQVTGRRLPLSALFDAPTVEALAALMRGTQEAKTTSPLVAIQPRGSSRPFFCVHAAGGSVFSYVGLARALGDGRPFYGLQARGADGFAEPSTSVEEMAAEYVEAIRAAQREGPYLLGGWSLGGTIAFEMARQLRARGEAASLILLDAVAPNLLPAHEDDDDLAILSGFALHLGLSPEDAAALPDDFSALGREEQLALFFEQAKQSPALPRGFDFEQLRRLMFVYRSGLRAARSYRPAASPLRLTLLHAEATHGDDRADSDATLGWQSLTTEPVELRVVPGDHFTMLRDPHVAALAHSVAEACAADDQASLEHGFP